LQKAAMEAERRLSALEQLTDPGLNPASGADAVDELLACLRATVDADAVAFVSIRPSSIDVMSSVGLRPEPRAPRATDTGRFLNPRVTLVHNDRARIEQTSAVRWPATVTSLIAVPVICDGEPCAIVEVVNDRPKSATDWDVALIRVVADRLGAVGIRPATATAAMKTRFGSGPARSASGY
jgi:hypothetical protein